MWAWQSNVCSQYRYFLYPLVSVELREMGDQKSQVIIKDIFVLFCLFKSSFNFLAVMFYFSRVIPICAFILLPFSLR